MKIDYIAKLAGVSKSAVSLALNGKSGVSEETRDRILKIAKESGYKHKSFLNDASQEKSIIRFIVVKDTSFVNEQYDKMPFFSELIRHVQLQCAQIDFEMVLTSINLTEVINNDFAHTEYDQQGVILLGTNLSKTAISIIKKHYQKVVVLDISVPELEVDFVVMNNKMGIFQAVQHLADLGHTNIGYIKSSERILNLDERYESFQIALQEILNTKLFTEFSITSNFLGINEPFQKWYLSLNNKPTAILCENDYLAISVIKSLLNLGVKVPEEVSVVGFDNIMEAIVLTPELSTVHVDKQQMAIKAVNRLKAIMMNEEVGIKVIVDTKFIARASTRSIQ